MCGIVGKYNYGSGEPVSGQLIRAMCDTLVHRGPDDGGSHIDGPVGLGHRRLSILDLSEQGHQPMHSRDERIWITFNGEIYNYQELQSELSSKGFSFRSNCDTEVILYLYEEYGEECVNRLRGMFAFAIWDGKRKQLLMVRDRIGKKPLYYYNDGKSLVFASEIKAILADKSVKKDINAQAVYDYFKYQYVPDPKSIYKNIHKLEPGHLLTCNQRGLADREYWNVDFSISKAGTETEIADELLHILKESVRLRMISDVPLGAFLSGGIDSSCVVALMAGHQEQPVSTCTIGFNSEEFDEIAFARKMAEIYHTDHSEYTVQQKAKDILPHLIKHFDEPFADSSAIPTFYVSKLARRKVTVALSGDGGDENFFGYEKYRLEKTEDRIRSLFPSPLRKAIFPLLSRVLAGANHRVFQKGSTLLKTLGREPDYGFFLTNTEIDDDLWSEMLTPDFRRELGGYDPFWITRDHYHKAQTDDHLSRILYTDLKMYLPGDILVKVDRMSMANSLEVRSPFLDHHIIELAARVPISLKFRRGEKKYILKRIFSQMLPEDILYRKKMGFCVPLADWLRGELRDFTADRILSPGNGLEYFFNKKSISRIWEMHQDRKRNFDIILWSLLVFEIWFQECYFGRR
ncbi:MAG: asparagine synthase (glutamine-hydrolyzing) [Deltaproteobacteria bacterium]|nr:asparagine synthase (glutamine-hydrolyzing) [Deltaproteobacteria bacterium]